jgi:hypothetical protein
MYVREAANLGFRIAIGALVAKSLKASWGQTATYVLVDPAIRCGFSLLVLRKCPSVRYSIKVFIPFDIACRVAGCVSGILATRFVCDKPIEPLQAFLVQVVFHDIVNLFFSKVRFD